MKKISLILLIVFVNCNNKDKEKQNNLIQKNDIDSVSLLSSKEIIIEYDTLEVYKDLNAKIDSTTNLEWKSSMLYAKNNIKNKDYIAFANFDKITLNGKSIYFGFERNEILKLYGKPIKEYDPKHECGFLTPNTDEDLPYNSLEYKNVIFTGNDEEKYIVVEIDFTLFDFSKNELMINGFIINNASTIHDLRKILKKNLNIRDNKIVLNDSSDDQFTIKFKDNKITSLYYWSPC